MTRFSHFGKGEPHTFATLLPFFFQPEKMPEKIWNIFL